MKTNRLLVRQAKKGDEEAFIQLIQNYEVILYNMARRFLKEEQDIADVMQETILSAYQNIGQLKNEQYFNTWIGQILINQCKKYLEKETWHIELEEDISAEKSADESSVDRMLDLEKALHALEPKYRMTLTLFYYNGFSIKEIAEVMSEPIGTVKNRLFRGKAALRAKLI